MYVLQRVNGMATPLWIKMYIFCALIVSAYVNTGSMQALEIQNWNGKKKNKQKGFADRVAGLLTWKPCTNIVVKNSRTFSTDAHP